MECTGRGMLHWTLPMPGVIASFFQSLLESNVIESIRDIARL